MAISFLNYDKLINIFTISIFVKKMSNKFWQILIIIIFLNKKVKRPIN